MIKSILQKIITSSLLFLLPALFSFTACSQGEGDLLDPAKGINLQGGSASGVTSLSAPTGLTAIANTGYVQLSWSSVSGATKYSVSRASNPNGLYNTILEYTPTSGVYSIKDYFLDTYVQNTDNHIWYYKVNAITGGISSDWSDYELVDFPYSFSTDSTLKPTNLNVAPFPVGTGPGSYFQINCMTNTIDTDVQIFRYTNSEFTSDQTVIIKASDATGILSTPDSNVLTNQTYWYLARSISNINGVQTISSLCQYASATITIAGGGGTFGPPQNVQATNNLFGQVNITWDPVYGSGYTVYYMVFRMDIINPQPLEITSPINPLTQTSFSDTNTNPLQTYYYFVWAHINETDQTSQTTTPVTGMSTQFK